MSASTPPQPSRAGKPSQAFDLTCPQCGSTIRLERPGVVTACPKCRAKLGKAAQLDQLLARWYEPRRWRADLVRPNVPYLVEKLWTANGQGQRLFEGIAPKYANFDIFRHLVTRAIIQGLDAGWADITFPKDPLAEDPQYELRIVDSEQFARAVEALFPEVDWDEPVEGPPTES